MEKSKVGEKRHSEIEDSNCASLTAREEKLLKLAGGKKAKNENIANKWIENNVHSRKDDIKISTDLESQFTKSLDNKLSGKTRKHVGIGFTEDVKSLENQDNSTIVKGKKTYFDDDGNEVKKTSEKTKESTEEIKEKQNNDNQNASTKPLVKSKKDFYAQFKKAS